MKLISVQVRCEITLQYEVLVGERREHKYFGYVESVGRMRLWERSESGAILGEGWRE